MHTGDSITVAGQLTLTDKDRETADARRVAGGPARGRRRHRRLLTCGLLLIARRPDDRHRDEPARITLLGACFKSDRVPHCESEAQSLVVGYTLDELDNDITGGATPASFEPSIDYVARAIPRLDFEKFPQADPTLTTQMKSVGRKRWLPGARLKSLSKGITKP